MARKFCTSLRMVIRTTPCNEAQPIRVSLIKASKEKNITRLVILDTAGPKRWQKRAPDLGGRVAVWLAEGKVSKESTTAPQKQKAIVSCEGQEEGKYMQLLAKESYNTEQ